MTSIFWRPDPVINAARARKGWKDFHRVCGTRNLFFDALERTGKKYRCVALTLDGFEGGDSMGAETRHRRVELSNGLGADPVAAIADAFEKSGRADDPDMRAALNVLTGSAQQPVIVPSLDDLLG